MSKKAWALIKFLDEEHVESFVDGGVLHMRPFAYFSSIEDKKIREDKWEGTDWRLGENQIKSLTINGKEIEKITELRTSRESSENAYIFCMVYLDEQNYKQGSKIKCVAKFREFGSKAVIIPSVNIGKFIEKINTGICKNNSITPYEENKPFGSIEYVPANYNGFLGPFKKNHNYSWQCEWRIVLLTRKHHRQDFYELIIGDISDLCIVHNTEDLILKGLIV